MTRSLRWILVLLAASLAGCGFLKMDDVAQKGSSVSEDGCVSSTESGAPLTDVESFKTAVWPVAQTRCGSCHGQSQSPRFAVSDPAQAFSAAKPLLDSSLSLLETRSGDGHCGSNCNDPSVLRDAVAKYHAAMTAAPAATCVSQKDSAGESPAPAATPTPTPTPRPTPRPTPQPGTIAVGQDAYDIRCAGCHRLGTYDTVGSAPNLAGKEDEIDSKFRAGVRGHKGITLTADQIAQLANFIALY